MSRYYPAIDGQLQEFIEEQQMFSTATTPASGRVNISPKGVDTPLILGPNTVDALIVGWKENGCEIVQEFPEQVVPIERGKVLRSLKAYVATATAS
jgi:hypothetical protein